MGRGQDRVHAETIASAYRTAPATRLVAISRETFPMSGNRGAWRRRSRRAARRILGAHRIRLVPEARVGASRIADVIGLADDVHEHRAPARDRVHARRGGRAQRATYARPRARADKNSRQGFRPRRVQLHQGLRAAKGGTHLRKIGRCTARTWWGHLPVQEGMRPGDLKGFPPEEAAPAQSDQLANRPPRSRPRGMPPPGARNSPVLRPQRTTPVRVAGPFRYVAGTRGLDHSFDRHSAEWFGRPVSSSTHLQQWQALIEHTARSSVQVPWLLGGEPTIGHLARVQGKYFFAQFLPTRPARWRVGDRIRTQTEPTASYYYAASIDDPCSTPRFLSSNTT
jgi:hypothetical protein